MNEMWSARDEEQACNWVLRDGMLSLSAIGPIATNLVCLATTILFSPSRARRTRAFGWSSSYVLAQWQTLRSCFALHLIPAVSDFRKFRMSTPATSIAGF